MTRLTREMPTQTKQAISNSLTGRTLSPTHRANISAALVNYWKTIPSKENNDRNGQNYSTQAINKLNENSYETTRQN